MSDETKAVDTKADAPGAAPTLSSIPRTFEAIQKEYRETAEKLGHVVFQVAVQKSEIEQLKQRLNDLGLEASKLPKPPPAAPAKKLAAVPTAPKGGSDGT